MYDTSPRNLISKWYGCDLNPGSLVLDHYILLHHLPFNTFRLPINCDAQVRRCEVSLQKPGWLLPWASLLSSDNSVRGHIPHLELCSVQPVQLHMAAPCVLMWTSLVSAWLLWSWEQERFCCELLIGGKISLEVHIEYLIWTKSERFRESLGPVLVHCPLRYAVTSYLGTTLSSSFSHPLHKPMKFLKAGRFFWEDWPARRRASSPIAYPLL